MTFYKDSLDYYRSSPSIYSRTLMYKSIYIFIGVCLSWWSANLFNDKCYISKLTIIITYVPNGGSGIIIGNMSFTNANERASLTNNYILLCIFIFIQTL